MISAIQAVNYALQRYKDLKYTGVGYFYEGDYYVELAPLDYEAAFDRILVDSMYKVDGQTGQVSEYAPLIDGFHDPKRIRPIKI